MSRLGTVLLLIITILLGAQLTHQILNAPGAKEKPHQKATSEVDSNRHRGSMWLYSSIAYRDMPLSSKESVKRALEKGGRINVSMALLLSIDPDFEKRVFWDKEIDKSGYVAIANWYALHGWYFHSTEQGGSLSFTKPY